MDAGKVNPPHGRDARSGRTRLRIAACVLAFLSATWLFYPFEVYRGHLPTYLAVDETDGKSEFAGVVSTKSFDHPLFAALDLIDRSSPRHSRVRLNGEKQTAYWSVHPGDGLPGTLMWRTRNLVWTLEPADSFATHSRGTPEWIEAMNESASASMAGFDEGTLESNQIVKKRMSLGWLLLQRLGQSIDRWW
jgi:hypothetical protein